MDEQKKIPPLGVGRERAGRFFRNGRGFCALLTAAMLFCSGTASGAADAPGSSPKIYSSSDPRLDLGVARFPNGISLRFRAGLGSGAFRHPTMPPMVLQTITDAGPLFGCKKGAKLTTLTRDALCAGLKKALIHPLPAYAPSIYTLRLDADGRFRVLDSVVLKDRDGKPLSGLFLPPGKGDSRPAFDAEGKALKRDMAAVDPEAMVRLGDGSYWIADESAPSLLRVSPSGRVTLRLVPFGMESGIRTERYQVSGGLPRMLAKRRRNRGLESLALSPDERFLYFATQGPLANPRAKDAKRSRNIRLYKFDRTAQKAVGEFVYVLERPESFRRDDSDKQSAVKISAMTAIGGDRLLVLERIRKSTKLFAVDLGTATNILGSRWDRESTRPSLEQILVSRSAIRPVSKALAFDGDAYGDIPEKLEGMALLGDGTIALLNDNDFGIEGAPSLIAVIKPRIGK
ncbi:MAG: esterase-like activity of phytase family protein [Alphaproteobacteria bacterium]|nr:esterase-like activity of phytase family protein [Alphaproteobacteria bacterium]